MEPILKWAGGKRQILNSLRRFVPVNDIIAGAHCYYEPFIGGGSLCFALSLPNVAINDLNPEVINVYQQIAAHPNQLIYKLRIHQTQHSEEYYYRVRGLDRQANYNQLSQIDKAARIIYLNRTCYNGLYRVNADGQFNVPLGRYENPDIVMEERIRALHDYFSTNHILITNQDFALAVQNATAGDFVYFDPPYDYDGSGFTTYMQGGFTHEDTTRLKELCDDLIERGCTVLISNNETQFVTNLFNEVQYRVFHIDANRSINSKGEKRKQAKEVIIYGRR